jgi:hypothetical protein
VTILREGAMHSKAEKSWNGAQCQNSLLAYLHHDFGECCGIAAPLPQHLGRLFDWHDC